MWEGLRQNLDQPPAPCTRAPRWARPRRAPSPHSKASLSHPQTQIAVGAGRVTSGESSLQPLCSPRLSSGQGLALRSPCAILAWGSPCSTFSQHSFPSPLPCMSCISPPPSWAPWSDPSWQGGIEGWPQRPCSAIRTLQIPPKVKGASLYRQSHVSGETNTVPVTQAHACGGPRAWLILEPWG